MIGKKNSSRGVKNQVRSAINKTGVMRLAVHAVPAAIAILRYHSVQEDRARFGNSVGEAIIHSLATFRQQMETVAVQFDPISMDDTLQFLRGERSLPRRPVVVTFDDGFADNAELAAPVLNQLGIPGTFYVTINPVNSSQPPWFCCLRHAFAATKKKTWLDSVGHSSRNLDNAGERKAAFLVASERCAQKTGEAQNNTIQLIEKELEVEPFAPGNNFMMTWDQVRSLRKAGHIIGSHTLSHPNLAHISKPELAEECRESKKKLEAELGAEVIHFSYPSPILQPHWTEQTANVTQECGYQTAVTSTAGPVRGGSDPFHLQRMAVPHDQDEFLWTLECTLLGRRM